MSSQRNASVLIIDAQERKPIQPHLIPSLKQIGVSPEQLATIEFKVLLPEKDLESESSTRVLILTATLQIVFR
jgi:hypothetical protein